MPISPKNERCDQLAVQASKMPNLQIDYYYEAEQDNNLKLFTLNTEKYFNF